MINPFGTYLWIGGLVLVVSLVGGAGFVGYRSGSAIKQGQWDASVVAKKSGEDAALKAAADAIAKIEVKSVKYIQPTLKEIHTNTVYRDCKHSDDSLRNINALITGDEPSDYGIVPSTKPTQ